MQLRTYFLISSILGGKLNISIRASGPWVPCPGDPCLTPGLLASSYKANASFVSPLNEHRHENYHRQHNGLLAACCSRLCLWPDDAMALLTRITSPRPKSPPNSPSSSTLCLIQFNDRNPSRLVGTRPDPEDKQEQQLVRPCLAGPSCHQALFLCNCLLPVVRQT